MDKEIIKAMKKKQTKIYAFKKWWGKNGYKVMRVILFPIWIYIKCKEKISHKINKSIVWDESRADEILRYYVPRYADWDAEDNTLYFFDNGYGWGMKYAKKHLKLKDRRFWDLYACCFGGKIRDYLIEKFELEGFTKEVHDADIGYTDITFTMKRD